ncbi:28S ribosomal protein S35, mitochondrial [Homalodisca vitripennis]|nr:28S ribosomal protein S35, mitochondrial [Homalodisca vitripennis]
MTMLSFIVKKLSETMVNSHITLNRIIQQRQTLNTVSKKMMETSTKDTGENYTDEFRVLDLKKMTTREKRPQRQRVKFEVPPPRTTLMKEDQDWTNVWPGPRTFHPAVVPLPLRQGHNKKKAAPGKYANAELMKIPNFLHLTPPAIEKHCKAIKKYCTQWPAGLETDEKCAQHFPVEVITSDYCHSSPTIRDPLARIVTIKWKTGLKTDEKCAQYFPVDVITSDYCHSSPTIQDPLARIVTIKVAKDWEKDIGYFLSRSRFRIPPHWSLKVTEIPVRNALQQTYYVIK